MKMNKLYDILSYNRKYKSVGEQHIINTYIKPHNPIVFHNDRYEPMAYVVHVGEPTEILWSCHTDTIHKIDDPAIHQIRKLSLPPSLDKPSPEIITLVPNANTTCLGADNGAGMWLLLEMIEANVSGTYIFHHGEECGGIGSNYMARYEIDFLSQFTHAIAFDRRGIDSIITHQLNRCCSDKFARDFGDIIYGLSNHAINLNLDSTGIFTDTANYVGIISECTNISIGYYNEHTKNEYLDLNYLQTLRDTMIKFPTKQLSTYEFQPSSYDLFSFNTKVETVEDIRDLVFNNPEEAIKLLSYYII